MTGFSYLLRAEWTKLRTVPGWVAGIAVAAFLIVGVVTPIKFQGLDEDVTKESVYYPFSQVTGNNVVIAARTEGEASSACTMRGAS